MDRTTCCVVGAGPAGAMLALLLARRGIRVTLLERHLDFERDFRGDTLHPGVLELLDQLGLVEQVLAVPHSRMQTLAFHSARGSVTVADLGRLRTRYPFVAMLPQARFLEVLVRAASEREAFRFIPGADARELVCEDGQVRGVRYRDGNREMHELRADLVVATDGRGSQLRRQAGLEAIQAAPEIDVLWFRLPRHAEQQGGGYLAAGGYMIVLPRQDQWQIGYVIPKGRYPRLKSAGLDALRESVTRLAPGLAKSVPSLTDWSQVRLLSVQADRLRRWYRPGLLLLGDAAHVMSPVGGVGINYAIQDAVEAASRLAEPLSRGRLTTRDLRRVQTARQLPTRMVQALQAFDQRYLIQPALNTTAGYRLPWWFRLVFGLPGLRQLPSRLFAFGLRRQRLDAGFRGA